jgi:starch-binding outer membrane protein, SusD/RagB family
MKSINKIITALLPVIVLVAGCSKDFLDRAPLSDISTDNFYQTTEELRLATAALYAGAPWGEWNYSCYLPIGEVMSGNMVLGWNGDAIQFNTFGVTEFNQGLIANWKSMYKVIAHCNTTINAITEKAPATIPESARNAAIGEAKFIRAFAYYNLVMLWKEIPIIEDNIRLINSPLVFRNMTNDVYQFIVNDLTFAALHLPPTDDKGRLTTWSAQGMLAKVYLTWAGLKSPGPGQRDQALLDMAKFYAGQVCKRSGLELMEDYADLFKTQYNDSPESLFALQWHPNTSDWLSGNMLQVYSPGGTEISANGQAGWFGIRPTYDIIKQYEQGDVRRKATFMLRDLPMYTCSMRKRFWVTAAVQLMLMRCCTLTKCVQGQGFLRLTPSILICCSKSEDSSLRLKVISGSTW